MKFPSYVYSYVNCCYLTLLGLSCLWTLVNLVLAFFCTETKEKICKRERDGSLSKILQFWRKKKKYLCHFSSLLTVNGLRWKWFCVVIWISSKNDSLCNKAKNSLAECLKKKSWNIQVKKIKLDLSSYDFLMLNWSEIVHLICEYRRKNNYIYTCLEHIQENYPICEECRLRDIIGGSLDLLTLVNWWYIYLKKKICLFEGLSRFQKWYESLPQGCGCNDLTDLTLLSCEI